MAVALKQLPVLFVARTIMVVNKTKQNVYYSILLILTTLSARNINYELRTTGQEAKEKKQKKKNFKTSRIQPPN